jgi:hypothetical protein
MEQIERKDGILEQRRKISADILMLDWKTDRNNSTWMHLFGIYS